MKRIFAAVSAAVLIAAVSGCTDGRYGHGYGSVAVGYDGYYDDYYGPGPFYDGYWGDGGAFYFSDGPGHSFRRDDGHHFRHDTATGFHSFHGNRPAGAMRHGGDHDHSHN